MARRAFKLPDIGEGVVEGEVVTWHVEVGASVSEDDSIVDIMTDKSTVTIPSPYSGVIVALHGEIGDMVAVGAVLVEFDSEEGGDSVAVSEEPDAEEAPDIVETAALPAREPEASPAVTPPPVAKAPIAPSGPVLASPAVRRRARESGVDLGALKGTGPGGRVQQSDLDAYLATGGSSSSAPKQISRNGTTEIKVVGLRRKIAEQMVRSKSAIPHFSYFEEIDITELEALRQLLNSSRGEEQPKLTYLPFIMMARCPRLSFVMRSAMRFTMKRLEWSSSMRLLISE